MGFVGLPSPELDLFLLYAALGFVEFASSLDLDVLFGKGNLCRCVSEMRLLSAEIRRTWHCSSVSPRLRSSRSETNSHEPLFRGCSQTSGYVGRE